MDTTELTEHINNLDKIKCTMTFAELVDKIKDACNNFAVKSHCQSTFLIDKEKDFLAEIFTKEINFFVALHNRGEDSFIVIYEITHTS